MCAHYVEIKKIFIGVACNMNVTEENALTWINLAHITYKLRVVAILVMKPHVPKNK
jgi:hypothetical protein